MTNPFEEERNDGHQIDVELTLQIDDCAKHFILPINPVRGVYARRFKKH